MGTSSTWRPVICIIQLHDKGFYAYATVHFWWAIKAQKNILSSQDWMLQMIWINVDSVRTTEQMCDLHLPFLLVCECVWFCYIFCKFICSLPCWNSVVHITNCYFQDKMVPWQSHLYWESLSLMKLENGIDNLSVSKHALSSWLYFPPRRVKSIYFWEHLLFECHCLLSLIHLFVDPFWGPNYLQVRNQDAW